MMANMKKQRRMAASMAVTRSSGSPTTTPQASAFEAQPSRDTGNIPGPDAFGVLPNRPKGKLALK